MTHSIVSQMLSLALTSPISEWYSHCALALKGAQVQNMGGGCCRRLFADRCARARHFAEVVFSPDHGAMDLVIRTIASAKSNIRVAAYGFTSKPIALALLKAHKRGVDVRIVLDKSNASARYSTGTFLANQGVPIRINHRYAIMHHKFIVIDVQTVETGSFNFSRSAAEANAENVIVLHDARRSLWLMARNGNGFGMRRRICRRDTDGIE